VSDQLELIPAAPPSLTDRQEAVLAAVTASGPDGWWAHDSSARCDFCARDGRSYLERLRELGHVRYRRRKGDRPGGWLPAGDAPDDASLPPGMTDEIPY
jgi:hypothetical protein